MCEKFISMQSDNITPSNFLKAIKQSRKNFELKTWYYWPK